MSFPVCSLYTTVVRDGRSQRRSAPSVLSIQSHLRLMVYMVFLSGGLLSGGWLVSVISDFDVHSVVLPADAKNTARTSSVPGLSAVRFGAMRFSGFLEKITRASTLRPQTEQFHLIGSTIMHNRRPFLLISRRLNLGLSLRRNHLKLLLSRET